MIEVRVGYDTIYDSRGEVNPYGSAQWCTFYISDDFKDFYDTDGEEYFQNVLAPVRYDKKVQEFRELFVDSFDEINSVDDLQLLDGVLFVDELLPTLPY